MLLNMYVTNIGQSVPTTYTIGAWQ